MRQEVLKHSNRLLIRVSLSELVCQPWKQLSSFLSGLLSCVQRIHLHTSTIAIEKDKIQVHSSMRFCHKNQNVISSNIVITRYARDGRIDDARQLFDNMSERDVVSWTAMVTGYVQNERLGDARQVFDKMPQRNVVSWNAMIAGYAKNRKMNDARMLFDKMPDRDMVSWTMMIVGYARNGRLVDARKLFDEMPERNIVSWNAMITGYTQNGRIDDGRVLFDNMPERNVVSWTAMIAGYCDNGRAEEAVQLFDKMPERSVVSWTAMIAGYIQNGLEEEALNLFTRMVLEGMKPNPSTFTSVLNACARLGISRQGKQIHTAIIKMAFQADVFVSNVLIAMYSKFSIDDAWRVFEKMPARDMISWNTMMAGYFQHGRLMDAHCLFHGMPEKDVVSWTGMITGYAQNGHSEEALKLFSKMKRQGINPNRSTFASILSACASIAALEQGKQIHDHIVKTEYSLDVFVGNALVTMYSKCGSISIAYQVFGQMTEQDVVSWTAIISGFAQHGSGKKALELFEQMQQVGIKPNHVTFVGVLTACSHSCLLDEGWQHFYSMIRDHGITPGVDHYACMVDLLGRMGLLTEAEDFIKNMPLQPDPVVWKALLGGCAVHRNLEVGERVAKELFKLEPQNSAAYVLLSNIYATTGRWDDVTKVRLMMKNIGVQKGAGCSWIEIKNKVHAFIVGDRSHPQIERIHAVLDELSGKIREAGYVPERNFALHDVQAEEKQHMLF